MDPKDIVQFHVLVHDPRRLPNPLAEGTVLSGGYSSMFFMTVVRNNKIKKKKHPETFQFTLIISLYILR